MRLKLALLLAGLTALLGQAAGGETLTLPNGAKAELKKVKTEKEAVSLYQMTFTDEIKHERITVPVYRFGNYYCLQAFEVKDGRLTPVVNVKVEKLPLDVSFLRKIERQMRQAGVNNVAGKRGAPVLYVIFDAYCPFCVRAFRSHFKELSKSYEVHFVPFAVHGEVSERALACILERWRRERPDEVLKEVFGRFNGNWEEYGKQFKNCPEDLKKLVQSITEELLKNGVRATPTFIYQRGNNFYLSIGKPPKGGER